MQKVETAWEDFPHPSLLPSLSLPPSSLLYPPHLPPFFCPLLSQKGSGGGADPWD